MYSALYRIQRSEEMTYNILGLGQPLLDRILQVDESVVRKLGITEIGGSSLITDASELEAFKERLHDILKEEYENRVYSSDESDDSERDQRETATGTGTTMVVNPWKRAIIVPGGSCANTIKGLASFGEKCAFIGKIGKDSVGQLYKDSMRKRGVIPLMTDSMQSRTGEVICLITPNGERTMRAFLGASLQMNESDLLEQDFVGIKLLHIEGYSIYNLPLTLKAMQLAKQNASMVSFDLGSFELVRKFKPILLDLLRNYVDIVFANREEAKELISNNSNLNPVLQCQQQKDNEDNSLPERCVDYLAGYCRVAVVMMGKDGCWVKSGNEKYKCPADVVANPIDTTGAGDLFASGFLHAYLQGYTLQQCARMGALTGKEVLFVMGAEVPIERFKKIKSRVNSSVFYAESLSKYADNTCMKRTAAAASKKFGNAAAAYADSSDEEDSVVQLGSSWKTSHLSFFK